MLPTLWRRSTEDHLGLAWYQNLLPLSTLKEHIRLVARKPVFGVCDPAPIQRLARVLKFGIEKLEILYYVGSEQ